MNEGLKIMCFFQYKDKVTRERNAQGSAYMRVFGNELSYLRTDFRRQAQDAQTKKFMQDFAAAFISVSEK